MESQSTQPSLRQAIPARTPVALAAAAVAAATNSGGNSYLPVELMMYNPRPLVPPAHALPLPNCLFSNQFCSCAYGIPSQVCSVHHAPIAYGQASSSFVAPTTSTAAPTASIPPPGPDHHLPPGIPSASNLPAVDMARRETRLPPTLLQPVRTSTRLKRTAPGSLPPQVQSALEEAGRAPKLRRIPSENGREIQTVSSETIQQSPLAGPPLPHQYLPTISAEPPVAAQSTSQLVTGTVPSNHPGSCTRCNTQCNVCPSVCQCAYGCPAARAALVQPAASRANYTVPPIGQINHTPIPQLYIPTQPPPVQQIHQPESQHHLQLQILQARLALRQTQHQQLMQSIQQTPLRYTYVSNGQLLVPVGRSQALGLEALLVAQDWIDPIHRNPLDRHHMFGAPVTEPQPIGCTIQEIEKYSEKLQFVKDIEVPDAEQERCIVCQCELETGEEIRHLSCNHQFHVECIDRWLSYNKKCPVCRLDIDQPKAEAKDAVWIE